MDRIFLAISDPHVRQTLDEALTLERMDAEGFEVRHSSSLQEARALLAKCASAILLFDNRELDETVLREVSALRKAAPGCILCCVSAQRDFFRGEEKRLQAAGVHLMLAEKSVTDAERLIAKLHTIAANLSGARVLARLGENLPPIVRQAAHSILISVCDVANGDIHEAARATGRSTVLQ